MWICSTYAAISAGDHHSLTVLHVMMVAADKDAERDRLVDNIVGHLLVGGVDQYLLAAKRRSQLAGPTIWGPALTTSLRWGATIDLNRTSEEGHHDIHRRAHMRSP
jgi:hypothetical protein